MKDKPLPLRIYSFSHPLMQTEWLSVLSDKYQKSLSFDWEVVRDYASADVVVWDGVITPKNAPLVDKMIDDFKTTKVLMLLGESITLLKDHPFVKLVDTKDLKYVEISGWTVLPEEILAAIELCQQKLKHV